MRGDCRLIHPGAAAPFAGAMLVGSSSSLLLELFDKPERVTMFDDVSDANKDWRAVQSCENAFVHSERLFDAIRHLSRGPSRR